VSPFPFVLTLFVGRHRGIPLDYSTGVTRSVDSNSRASIESPDSGVCQLIIEVHVDLVWQQVVERRRQLLVAALHVHRDLTQIGAEFVHQFLRRFLGEPPVPVVEQRFLPQHTDNMQPSLYSTS